MMEFGIEFLYFAGLVSGAVGSVLGSMVGKGEAGFFLGAFLGPIGWIIVFLLPRDSEGKENDSENEEDSTISGNTALVEIVIVIAVSSIAIIFLLRM